LTSRGDKRKYRVGLEDRLEKESFRMGKGLGTKVVVSVGREESHRREQ